MKSEDLNWRDLQASIATRSAITLCLCSWGVWWYLLAHPVGVEVAILAILTFGAGLALWYQAARHPQMVAYALVAVTFAVAALAVGVFNHFYAGAMFILPILLAVALLGTPHAVAVGLASCLFLYGVTAPIARPLLWTGPIALIAVVTLFQIPVLAAFRSSLYHNWLHSMRFAALVQEARTHRGEVSRLNKSLNLANSLLQRHVRELAAARLEAENARQQKEQFAVYVSHELRTPLNIILGFLEIMQRYPEVYGDVTWTPMLRRDIAEIQRSARHLSDLVDDLLDLARIDALKMPLRRELANLEDVLQEAIELTGRMAQGNEVALHMRVEEPLPPLLIDQTRIRQVVLNLLTNASRFTRQGEICVRAFAKENEIVVSVSDTGPGIPVDELDRLFQNYQQVSPLDATPGEGKGLGLAIAKHFVQMHGGCIWAKSELGRGSTFFTLLMAASTLALLPIIILFFFTQRTFVQGIALTGMKG